MDCTRKLVYTANFFMLLNSEIRPTVIVHRALTRQLQKSATVGTLRDPKEESRKQQILEMQVQVLALAVEEARLKKRCMENEYVSHRRLLMSYLTTPSY